MKNMTKNLLKKTGTAVFSAACLFSLFLPLPKKISNREFYDCVWADGSVTEENYSSAYKSLAGMDGESVILLREGLTGKIESEASTVFATLENGNFAQIIACRAEGTRIDSAALYREFSDRVWYNGEYYVWTGNKIERVSRASRSEIVFLEGNVSPRVLKETDAIAVYLRKGAEVSITSFAESKVENVYTESPYAERGGAVYLDTAGGKRLLAALGGIRGLTLCEDLSFADEGALIACQALASLTVPFWETQNLPQDRRITANLRTCFRTAGNIAFPKRFRASV